MLQAFRTHKRWMMFIAMIFIIPSFVVTGIYSYNRMSDSENDLATKLLAFEDTVKSVAEKAMPHLLCTYLFELSGIFMRFYEACPVLKGDVALEIKASRLALCDLTAKVLKQGLGLLGINTMEQM